MKFRKYQKAPEMYYSILTLCFTSAHKQFNSLNLFCLSDRTCFHIHVLWQQLNFQGETHSSVRNMTRE